jgi:hypothetical protein
MSGLLKKPHVPTTKDTVSLHALHLSLPPLAAWARAEIDDAELGSIKERDERAKQRAAELSQCEPEDRRDVSKQHEKDERALHNRVAWASSATGRFFDAVTSHNEDEQPRSMPGRVCAYCPVCQREHARLDERNAASHAAWIASMDPDERALMDRVAPNDDRWAAMDRLTAWREANPLRVTSPPDYDEGDDAPDPVLVIDHRYGKPTGSEILLACLAGCAPDAIKDAATDLIIDHERRMNRERNEKERARYAAELTPNTKVAGPTWLLPDFVPSGSLTILNGATGTMKTWIAESIAIAIATGRPFVGRTPSKRGRVLLVLCEAFAINLVRFDPLARGMEATCELSQIGIWPKGVPFKTHESSTMERLANYIRTQEFVAIVIDNLTEIRGGTSQNAENDATVMSAALRPLAQLAHDGTIDGVRVTNRPPAIVVLHHDRGSTAIGQHADYVLRLSRGSQAPEAPVTIKLGEGCRLASPGLPLAMRFRGMAPDPITPELVVRREQASEPEPAELTDRQRAIIAAMREQPGQSLRGVHRLVGGSLRDIGPSLRALEARGYSELRDGQWFAVGEE